VQIIDGLTSNKKKQDWIMSVSGFFDESGKFKDHSVISFSGVAATTELFHQPYFVPDWQYALHQSGLESLSAKSAFRHRVALSTKVEALGIDERIKALLPFVRAIRKNLQLIVGAAIDVEAFKKLPSHYYQILGDDPFFTAFLSMVMEVVGDVPANDQLSFICDDEEEMAIPMYRLYRRVKLIAPAARDKMVAISFADDRYLYGLQAADLVSSLIRREAAKKFFGEEYEYRPLFESLMESNGIPKTRGIYSSLWGCIL
jgi:hypothetical protein